MISRGQILFGAALTTVVASVALVLLRRERATRILIPALAATFFGPLTWNAILHRAATAADGFFVDIPFKPFPVSWQDTGSGVFTLAVASLLLGLTLRREPAGRILNLALTCAAVAFLVDIYCY